MIESIFLILAFLLAYLVGAVPSGLIMAQQFGGVDIRKHGSGNIGFTNVLRVCGKKVGIPVLILDVGKAVLVILFLVQLSQPSPYSRDVLATTYGLAVILGNLFNVFLGFKGGKGVATAFGVFLALAPIPVLLALLVFLATFFISKYVSLGSILAAVAMPVFVVIFQGFGIIAVLSIVIGLFVVIKHRTNIKRLLTGEEHRFTRSSD